MMVPPEGMGVVGVKANVMGTHVLKARRSDVAIANESIATLVVYVVKHWNVDMLKLWPGGQLVIKLNSFETSAALSCCVYAAK